MMLLFLEYHNIVAVKQKGFLIFSAFHVLLLFIHILNLILYTAAKFHKERPNRTTTKLLGIRAGQYLSHFLAYNDKRH